MKITLSLALLLIAVSLCFALEGNIPTGPAAGRDLSGPAPAPADFSVFFPAPTELPDPELKLACDPAKCQSEREYLAMSGSGSKKRLSAWYRVAIDCWQNGAADRVEHWNDRSYAGAIAGAKYELQVNYLRGLKKPVALSLPGADEAIGRVWRQTCNHETVIVRRNNFIVKVYAIESGRKRAAPRFTKYFAELVLKKLAENGY